MRVLLAAGCWLPCGRLQAVFDAAGDEGGEGCEGCEGWEWFSRCCSLARIEQEMEMYAAMPRPAMFGDVLGM